MCFIEPRHDRFAHSSIVFFIGKKKLKNRKKEREGKEVRYVSDIDLIDAHAEIKNQLRVVKILRFQSLSYISYENGLFTRPESFFANGLVRPRQTRGDTVRWESRQDFCFSLFLFSLLLHLFLSFFPFSFLFSRQIFKSRSTDPWKSIDLRDACSANKTHSGGERQRFTANKNARFVGHEIKVVIRYGARSIGRSLRKRDAG